MRVCRKNSCNYLICRVSRIHGMGKTNEVLGRSQNSFHKNVFLQELRRRHERVFGSDVQFLEIFAQLPKGAHEQSTVLSFIVCRNDLGELSLLNEKTVLCCYNPVHVISAAFMPWGEIERYVFHLNRAFYELLLCQHWWGPSYDA